MQKASGLESNCILSLEELEEAQTRRQRQVTRTFHCIQTNKETKVKKTVDKPPASKAHLEMLAILKDFEELNVWYHIGQTLSTVDASSSQNMY